MGQVLHASATTTEAVRRAIQHSQESLRMLARRYGLNQKTVAEWKRRTSVADLPTGPREPRSTSLSATDEAIVLWAAQMQVELRRRLPINEAEKLDEFGCAVAQHAWADHGPGGSPAAAPPSTSAAARRG